MHPPSALPVGTYITEHRIDRVLLSVMRRPLSGCWAAPSFQHHKQITYSATEVHTRSDPTERGSLSMSIYRRW